MSSLPRGVGELFVPGQRKPLSLSALWLRTGAQADVLRFTPFPMEDGLEHADERPAATPLPQHRFAGAVTTVRTSQLRAVSQHKGDRSPTPGLPHPPGPCTSIPHTGLHPSTWLCPWAGLGRAGQVGCTHSPQLAVKSQSPEVAGWLVAGTGGARPSPCSSVTQACHQGQGCAPSF